MESPDALNERTRLLAQIDQIDAQIAANNAQIRIHRRREQFYSRLGWCTILLFILGWVSLLAWGLGWLASR